MSDSGHTVVVVQGERFLGVRVANHTLVKEKDDLICTVLLKRCILKL